MLKYKFHFFLIATLLATLGRALPSEKAQQSTPASPHKDTGNGTTIYERVVGPSYFYTGAMSIKCPSVDQVLNNLDYVGQAAHSLIPAYGRAFLGDFLRMRQKFETNPEVARPRLTKRLRRCERCSCNGTTGEMVATSTPGLREWSCGVEYTAQFCEFVLNCYCTVTLGQPPRQQGVSQQEYELAISQIPRNIRASEENQDWTWHNHPPPPTVFTDILESGPIEDPINSYPIEDFDVGNPEAFWESVEDIERIKKQRLSGKWEFRDYFQNQGPYNPWDRDRGGGSSGIHRRSGAGENNEDADEGEKEIHRALQGIKQG
ncbi:hypothetical protein TWF718_008464 [Orbilia javanica]|uniref:Uncharacterized protein n=1 Tax=Orbilia javanica TaxID=47235 RepID=A0AAN8RHP9_9PEZI